MSTMFRLLNEDGDIEIIENRPRIQYDTDLSKDGSIYDINEYYQTKRHYNIYKMDKELLEKEEEIERLNNIINELDTFLYDKIEHDKSTWGQVYSKPYQICRDKIKELKGSDK